MEKTELSIIKNNLAELIGQRVQLTTKKIRKRVDVNVGVIESVHPSIFIVALESNPSSGVHFPRRASFSYIDLLTKTVEIKLFTEEMVDETVIA